MAKASKKTVSRPRRLSGADWIGAGLRTMAKRGVANVRIERLARELKVTKGSFYWHFTDREALLDAMLSTWREQSSGVNQQVIDRHPGQPREQLRALLRLPQTTSDANEGSQIELALRLWARRDEHVSAMLQDMHRHRHKVMTRILADCGVEPARRQGLTLVLASVLLNLWTADGRPAAERDGLINMTIDIIDRYSH